MGDRSSEPISAGRNQPCWHIDLKLLNHGTVRKCICCFRPPCWWSSISAAQRDPSLSMSWWEGEVWNSVLVIPTPGTLSLCQATTNLSVLKIIVPRIILGLTLLPGPFHLPNSCCSSTLWPPTPATTDSGPRVQGAGSLRPLGCCLLFLSYLLPTLLPRAWERGARV